MWPCWGSTTPKECFESKESHPLPGCSLRFQLMAADVNCQFPVPAALLSWLPSFSVMADSYPQGTINLKKLFYKLLWSQCFTMATESGKTLTSSGKNTSYMGWGALKPKYHNPRLSREWQCTPVIPALQETGGSLQAQGQDYKLSPCLKCSNNNKTIIAY